MLFNIGNFFPNNALERRLLQDYHRGNNNGCSCYPVAFAKTGRGIVSMTNLNKGTRLIHELIRVMAFQYHWPLKPPGQ